jgi:hypothetical protein
VQRLFSSFPTGAAGLGLAILRMCVAGTLLCAALLPHNASVPAILTSLAVCIAIGIVAGAMLTPCCIAAVGLQLILARVTGWTSLLPTVLNMLHAIALACLGAGAYSVDALLYGRRILVLPKDQERRR